MSSNLPARNTPLLLGGVAAREKRAAGRQLASMQTGALLARAQDQTRCDLTLSRMSDIGIAVRSALAEGDMIAGDLAARIERNPIAANALSGIAEDGIRALRAEVQRLAER